MKSCILVLTVLAALAFTGCGGGTMTTTTTTPTYTISAAVTGLTGTLVLQDNLGGSLTFTSDTTQSFSNSYSSNASYSVSVTTQPAGQTCTPGSNSSGTATSNITVAVTCVAGVASTYTISAAVTGLTGTLVLQDNLGGSLTFTSDTTQSFSNSYSSNATYSVSVTTQPAGQTCTPGSNSSGTATSNITVAVTCVAGVAPTYTISAAVTGLSGGSLILQDSLGDQLTFTGNGTQTFATSYASGATYSVSGVSQPAGESCTFGSNSTGTITSNITVAVTCVSTSAIYTLSVTVTGLSGGSLVVQDNLNDQLTFTTNTTTAFATLYASGQPYQVLGITQPTGQTCTLGSNSSGTITGNTTVTATCTSTGVPSYSITAAATGLATGASVVLTDTANQLTLTSSSATQTFANTYASGASYAVTIQTQPTGQTCTLGSNASGTITANITVNVTCTTNPTNDTISVTATGLTGTLVVQDNTGAALTFTTNKTQTFSNSYTSGSTYSVTVETQPTGQTCTLGSNASGTITANITVTAACVTNTPTDTLSVTATGLTGTLVVQDNTGAALTFTSNNTQTFSNSYTSGSTYSVTVETQPTGQTCTLGSNASGTITANTTVTATCTTNVVNYTISVAVTGLTGTLVMTDSKSDTLTFTTNTTQTFATSYASGSTYTVTVKTQPSGQTCTLSSNASGTITANITVTATCAASGSGPTLSLAVTGLSGTVIMTDDQGDTLTFTSNQTQAFANSYTSGATYTVYVTTQPSAQACTPTYSTGTMSASGVTINIACATGATRALGTISGVSTITPCSSSTPGGTCQQMTVSCPGVPDVSAYIKTNTPTGTSLGTVTYNTGTDGNGLYDSIFKYGDIAVGNVLDAGFTTVQISWGTPFNDNQPNGWAEGPGGVLASACRYATVTQWIYQNIQNSNTSVPYCATANSGGAGALAYAVSQYNSTSILSMAEVTSGPPTGRLDWGCGCQEGTKAVQCGLTSTLGTCFGAADAPVWDPAYNPNASTGVCTAAVDGTLPPGGLNFFLGDSVEAPGAVYSFPKTYVNLVFGGADNSSAIPIGQDWFDNITSTKAQACVAGGEHSLADTMPGALQIANDLINLCKLQ